ncbi:MAG: Ig-like domain-containing protein, partial [Streptosporangiaceae bacterium]
MSYVTKSVPCTSQEKRVQVIPGPVFVCVRRNKMVYQVAALSDCAPPDGVQAFALPPSSARVYFCAADTTGVLTHVNSPSACKTGVIPVVARVVPHEPPVLANIESAPLPYTAGAPGVPITSNLTVSSPDASDLSGATVTISAGLVATEDVLSFSSQNGITGSYNSAAGVLTLSGVATLARYQAALRSVTYSDTNGAAPTTGTRTISFQVNDGRATSNLSDVQSRDVDVTASGPVISNVETTSLSYTAQSPPVQITSALTVSDPADATIAGATVSITSGFGAGEDTLSFTNQSNITGSYDSGTGILALTGDDSIANYQEALRSVQFSTSDGSASPAARTVSFTVTDSLSNTSAPAQRTIDVNAAPSPPTAVNQNYSGVGNTPLAVGTSPAGPAATVSGSVLDGDTDPDPSATLSVVGNTTPANGSVTMNPDGTFTYVPDAGFSGTDTFQYTIAGSNDPSQTATASVTITVGTVVWYVNDSQPAGGNGEADSPFSTLAAANSAAGSDSIVFLYQGSGTYTGGVTMQPGEDLWGQPDGLTVDGYSLVAAGGSAPAITNSGGDGIDLAAGADVEGVNVSSPSGNGIAALNINDATVGGSAAVAISGAAGDGIHV